MIAALYIDPRGPYPKLPGVDVWDEARDARLYAGPWPVVAHPPCGAWGSLRNLGAAKPGAELGPLAVAQVRRWGGALEHPRNSTLWKYMGLPAPGAPADAFGGFTVLVEQVSWGHPARKPTLLYLVRVDPALVAATMRTGGTPTHAVAKPGRATAEAAGLTWPCLKLKATHSAMNRRSPPDFAAWLVMLARSAAR